jgi:hypothetical protein
MKKSTYALMATNIILWSYFVWSGFDGIKGVKAQHVPGYPNEQQIEFYIVFPLLMVATSLAFPILLRRTRWFGVGTGILIATLLLLIPFGCAYTGGM